ncbi:hypothetical protein ACH3XW_15190 [Acanthocheilonema viteae]
MTNLVDSVITQIKKEDIDVERQCFAPEFKNSNELCRPSMNFNSDRSQCNNYKDITASGLSLLQVFYTMIGISI